MINSLLRAKFYYTVNFSTSSFINLFSLNLWHSPSIWARETNEAKLLKWTFSSFIISSTQTALVVFTSILREKENRLNLPQLKSIINLDLLDVEQINFLLRDGGIQLSPNVIYAIDILVERVGHQHTPSILSISSTLTNGREKKRICSIWWFFSLNVPRGN